MTILLGMLQHKKFITYSSILWMAWVVILCLLFLYQSNINQEDYHEVASWFSSSNVRIASNKNITKVYESLCKKQKDLCNDKITYKGEYTEEQKKQYAIITLYFTQTLDSIIGKEELIKAIKNVEVSFIKDKRRGYSTHNSVFLHTPWLSYQEYMMVFVHELGHIIDLWVLQGQSKKQNDYFTEFGEKAFAIDDISLQYYALSRDSEYQRKAIETRESFCSIYGMTSPFEDFAECFQLYINHQSYFLNLAGSNKTLAKKYAFFEKITKGNYLYKKLQNISYKDDTQYRYRDTTRMN